MGQALEDIDFAFDELPGPALHEALDSFRARAPVAATKFFGLPAWVITTHAALLDAFTDALRFPPHRMYEASLAPAVGESFISMADPERHRVYRKLATPAFRSRAVQSYQRDGLAALAHELVDGFAGQRSVDLVHAFTARFPYLVISRLLGLPRDREAEFHGWALALLRFRDDPSAARRAADELTAFLAPVVEARRREPRDDVISELVAARVDGRALRDEEIFAHVRMLFPTGGETTHGSLGNALHAVLNHPEVWTALRADPQCATAIVDEALRWETPIAVLPRLSASEPVEFHGVEIPADSWVLFATAASNRDPALHHDPHRFDPQRGTTDTLTFGRGAKSCPGMHLARTNMTVALQVLAERLPSMALVDTEASLPRRTVLRSPDALHVELN